MESPKDWSLARGFIVVASIVPVLYLLVATGVAWLGFGPEPFFVIPMALIGVVAIFWPNRWMMLVPGIIGIVAVIGSSQPGGDPGAFRPDRMPEFGYWWLGVIVGPALLIAAILNIRNSRAPAAATAGTSRWGVALVTLVIALYAGGFATATIAKAFVPPATSAAIAIRADSTFNVTAEKDAWTPKPLAVAAGKVVMLTVTNKDANAHVFNQDDTGLRVDLPAGATKTVWLRMDTAGTFQYYCELHAQKGSDGKWAGMAATLTVT